MKAIMIRLFGSQIAKDGSLRFTVLWNDVLVKVLKSGKLKAPEGDVIKSLTSYFSSALANQARDYLRRRKSHSKILDDHIKPLVEQRERYLKENYGIHIELLLEMAEKWAKAGDSTGTALRLRYIDGMTYEQIAEALGLSRDRVKRFLAEGRKRLNDIANQS
jgi:RNA polymerase sigma factor (sigma-70 family)